MELWKIAGERTPCVRVSDAVGYLIARGVSDAAAAGRTIGTHDLLNRRCWDFQVGVNMLGFGKTLATEERAASGKLAPLKCH